MDDTTAASTGFVLAGVALAATLTDWQFATAAAALAAVALAAFGLRRYGRLAPRQSAVVAGLGCIGVVGVAVYAAFTAGGSLGAVGAGLAGLGGLVAAYSVWLGLDRESLVRKAGATVRAVWVGGIGILAIFAWAIVIALLLRSVSAGDIGPRMGTVLSTLASGAGTLSVVALYLHFSERDLSYLDVRWPGVVGLAYAVGGIIVILAGNVSIGLAFQRAGVESATHTIVQTAEAEPTVLLVLIPLSYLIIAPGEELLYRNVIQKSLRDTFSPAAGVVVASAVFAAVHLPAYSSPGASFRATLSTLIVIFVLALVLGTVYEQTKNIVVPILVHGTFNAVAFAVTYAQLTGALGG